MSESKGKGRRPFQDPPKERLDEWLCRQGFFPTTQDAERAVRLGFVRDKKSGQVLDKPGIAVSKTFAVSIDSPERFVGRGGDKLDGFLEFARFDLTGLTALDVGSSTGGFVDCFLQRGVAQVYAVDVGTHQLHEKISSDPRVTAFEECDIRSFDFSQLKKLPDIVSIDVSFISAKSILPLLLKLLPRSVFVLLFKPQFEVGRYIPKKRGVVSEEIRLKSLEEMLLFLRQLGLNPFMVQDSQLKGSKGNQETFIMSQSSIPSHIFRTYDIRGHANSDFSDYSVERIGRVLGKRIFKAVGAKAQIGVGRDSRESSPRIYSALVRGLLSQNVEVVELGEVTTPMAYFSHYNFKIDALIQITASHNPKEDNGLKMMILKNTLFGDEITSIGEEAQNETLFPVTVTEQKPVSIHSELRQKYISYLHEQIKLKRKFKIAVDCGNGMAGMIAREVFAPYASELDIIFEEVDCSFPNHEADPTVPANLAPLQKLVLEKKADVGFAFDGDGDRLGVITSKGRILWGDEILMLLSELVLASRKGATIIGEVKCSEKLFRMIESKGGTPLMYKTGHSLIKKKMKELDAPLAGEMSGHLFFADRYFGYDDALYGALRVLEVMDQLYFDLDSWISTYPSSIVTPEIRVPCAETEKEGLVQGVKDYFSKISGAKLHLIDGVRVGFSDSSWALVRASNTQAVLVVRIEATSDERMKEIQKMISESLGRDIHV